MSPYPDDYEYYEPEPTEADEAFDSLKQSVFAAVKQEVKTELERLGKENRDLKEKVKNLDTLEAEAKSIKRDAEYAKKNATYEAKRDVQKEGIAALLALLTEPKYRIGYERIGKPKCSTCDDERQIWYTKPSGKKDFEWCACHSTTMTYTVEEQVVQEVKKSTRGHGEILVWHSPVSKYLGDDDRGFFGSATVLKSPENIPLHDQMKRPYDYGFGTREDAQKLADALNADKS